MASTHLQDLENIIVCGYIREETDKILTIPSAIKSECARFVGFSFVDIDSSILCNDEQKHSFFEILCGQSMYANVVSGVDLLFRGSRDGFDGSAFQSARDGKQNLIVIIQSENGNIFGGYASKGFCKNISESKYIEDEKAFLFLIESESANEECSLPKVYRINKENTNYAIHDAAAFDYVDGPAFGISDLLICDRCDEDCFSHLIANGDCYGIEDDAMFTGANVSHFLVTDYEVFYLD